MSRGLTLSLAFLLGFALVGCVSLPSSPAPVADDRAPVRIEAAGSGKAAPVGGKLYTVKKGDTLYGIALDHGVEYRDLAAWNGIDNPSRIRIGQQLHITPAEALPDAAVNGTEVRPIASNAPVASRALDEKPAAVPPSRTFTGDGESLKRGPLGGKLPYSEQNLALLRSRDAAPVVAIAPAAPPSAPPLAAPPAVVAAALAGSSDWVWPAPGKLLANFTEGGNGIEASKGIDIAGRIGDPVLAAGPGKVIFVGQMNKYGNLVIVLHGDGYSSVYAHNSRILVKEGQMVTHGQKIAELGSSDADQPKLHFELRQQGKPVDPLKFLPARR